MAAFCKIIERNDEMTGPDFAAAIDTITTVSHPRILKVKEIYADSHSIYLISDSLSGQYKNLMDSDTVLDEAELSQVLEQLVRVLRYLGKEGVTMKNLHPNNIFIKPDDPSDILITDVGFADIPGIVANTSTQTKFMAPELMENATTPIAGMHKVNEIVDEAPGTADIWSLGKIAMFLALGSTDVQLD